MLVSFVRAAEAIAAWGILAHGERYSKLCEVIPHHGITPRAQLPQRASRAKDRSPRP
jgi:hypothetical protein